MTIPGDWFQYSTPRYDLWLYSIGFFKRAAQVFEEIFVIPGNHDARGVGYATDFLKNLGFPNITYITPESKQFVYEVCDGVFAFFLPYLEVDKMQADYFDFVDARKDQIVKGKTILIGHLYDEHANKGSELELITKSISNVNFAKFKTHFDMVISGHIHTFQDYDAHGVRVIYPGTFNCHTKHDVGLDKHILMMDSDMGVHYQKTSHIKFVEATLSAASEDPFSSLNQDNKYIVYLTVKDFSGMRHEFDDWINEQYKKYPNIEYISDSHRNTSIDVSVSEVHNSSSGDTLLKSIVKNHIDNSVSDLPKGSSKDMLIKEFETHVFKEAIQ